MVATFKRKMLQQFSFLKDNYDIIFILYFYLNNNKQLVLITVLFSQADVRGNSSVTDLKFRNLIFFSIINCKLALGYLYGY